MFELDVRVLPPSDKHSTIHERLEDLSTGQTLRIINDRDPRPLRYELDDRYPGVFAWTYVECGPRLWRVDVARKSGAASLCRIDMVADCHALQVGEIRLKTGESRAFQRFRAAAALVFHEGAGTIRIAGTAHAIAAGTVELLCPGESCTIVAEKHVHAFVVVSKGEDDAS